jgi:hypothetical protein
MDTWLIVLIVVGAGMLLGAAVQIVQSRRGR